MAFTIDTTSYHSPNYDARPSGTVIDSIVLHDGEGTKASDLGELLSPSKKKSAHYYIDRAGHVYQLVDPKYRAWHAGVSAYLGRSNYNNFSVGIESEHKQGQDWPAVQKQGYADLVEYLISQYHIQQRYVVAHRWIAPGRRADPTDWPDSELIPWIAARFTNAWPSRWGSIATPSGDQWGWENVKAWQLHWQRLGKCKTHLLYDTPNNAAVQLFEGGDVRLFGNKSEVTFT
jgi:N-acetyl-anhydromuramyl-L-alanine amidase AmpD